MSVALSTDLQGPNTNVRGLTIFVNESCDAKKAFEASPVRWHPKISIKNKLSKAATDEMCKEAIMNEEWKKRTGRKKLGRRK